MHNLQLTRAGRHVPMIIARVLIGLILVTSLLSMPLGVELGEQVREGQARPLAYPLSESLHREIVDRIVKEPGVELILSARARGKRKNEIALILSSPTDVSPLLLDDLGKIVKEDHGQDIPVEFNILQAGSVASIVSDSDASGESEYCWSEMTTFRSASLILIARMLAAVPAVMQDLGVMK